jgi:hypothetical protein
MDRAALLLTITILLLTACGQPLPSVVNGVRQESAAATTRIMEAGEEGEVTRAGIAPLLDNLGDHHHPITTGSPLAQRYFDQGLILVFAFNHAEVIRSFKNATQINSGCAMCYWGIALALGPNINAPMEAAVPEAYEIVRKTLAPKTSEAEQAHIQALAQRYGPAPIARY